MKGNMKQPKQAQAPKPQEKPSPVPAGPRDILDAVVEAIVQANPEELQSPKGIAELECRLRREFGGQSTWVASQRRIDVDAERQRMKEIVVPYAAKHGTATAARVHGLCRRTVRRWTQEAERDGQPTV